MVFNYSLYSIPALWVVSLAPHLYAASLTKNTTEMEPFKDLSPREFLAKVQAQKPTPLISKYLRAEAAQQNGYEQIGLWGISILAANFTRLPIRQMNFYSGFYLISRVVYTLLYVNTTEETNAKYRSYAFMGGVGICFTLLIKSGNALNR